ncbi:MAG: hypothetical protein K6G66_10360 [Oscillospiraceae bacterium]|nr:hypothetical protein [Oscillospiraceae bacterium]
MDLGLKAGFEFKDKVFVVDRDPLNQPPDQTLVVIRHRLLLLFQKGFELVQPLLHPLAVGVFQKQGLFIGPEIFDLVSQVVKALFGVGLLQEIFLQVFEPSIDAALPDFRRKGVLLSLCTETKKPRHQPTAG